MDPRVQEREIELHLKLENMERYNLSFETVWSMVKSNAGALSLRGERVRSYCTTTPLMTHPMHLHGMWSELESPDVRQFLARTPQQFLLQPAQRHQLPRRQ